MLEAPLFSSAGARASGGFALPEPFFDGTVNEPVLHQAVTVFLNNQRQGTAATKTRSFVSGGNQKPWRQKGTGRARQGSTRAPHWRGGGTVFGPQPRDYRTKIPAKVRQLARRSAFNARAREGALLVVESLSFDAPKTAQLVALLAKLGVAGQKVLVLTHGIRKNLYLSSRNLPGTDVMPYTDASAYDILWAEVVVVERAALGGEAGAEVEVTEAPPAKKPRAAKAKAKAAPKAEPAPATRKPAARKAPAQKKKESE